MRKVMEDVRDTQFKEIKQEKIPDRQVKFSVTKFYAIDSLKIPSSNYALEFWIEYTIPKGTGVVIGTNIYLLSFQGDILLNESFGTHFIPQSS
jgi:hypothetical protein